MKETAVGAVGRAKATASRARRKGEQLATQIAKKEVVKQTGKGVAQVRNRAAVLARKVTDEVTGRARKRKLARIAAAVVGAAAVVAAAGVGVARRRKR